MNVTAWLILAAFAAGAITTRLIMWRVMRRQPEQLTTPKDLLAWSRKHYDNAADLELYDRIVRAWYSELPRHRQAAHWVMDAGWLARIKDMRDSKGEKLWAENATYLLGVPFEVRADGGFPHLELRKAGP